MESLLSAMDPDEAAGIGIAVISIVGGLLIVFVSMFLRHQQKMAALLNKLPDTAGTQPQVDMLIQEVRELKGRINDLVLRLEDRRELRERVGPPPLPDQLTR